MKKFIRTWLEHMYKEEIQKVKESIKDEHIWELGYDNPEDDFNPHTINIENLKEYIEVLEEKIEELKERSTKRYLLNVTFYAGSDTPEDTDNGLFILTVNKEFSKKGMEHLFGIVNSLLDPYRDDDEEFALTYNEGLNINTLMEGIELYTKGKVEKLYSNWRTITDIDGYYVIEQWQ